MIIIDINVTHNNIFITQIMRLLTVVVTIACTLFNCSMGIAQDQRESASDPGLIFRMGIDRLETNASTMQGGVTWSLLRPLSDGYYIGGSVYSAALGNAGGLYIGGIEFGRSISLNQSYFMDGSFFVGGGGGAAQVPGDGLTTRARLAMGRHLNDFGLPGWDVLLGLGRMNVAGSQINASSVELAFQRRIDFGIHTPQSRYSDAEWIDNPLQIKLLDISPRMVLYKPQAKGSSAIDLIGIEAEFSIAHSPWRPTLKAMGAFTSNAQGYADWVLGVRRYISQPTNNVAMFVDAGVGTGGGGAVNTGGGLLLQAGAGVKVSLTPSWAIVLDAGRLHSQGAFQANYLGAAIHWQDKPGLSTPSNSHSRSQWSLRPSLTQIMGNSKLRKTEVNNYDDLWLMDLQFERAMSPHQYLLGRASTAFQGDAGGFAGGQLGWGLYYSLGSWYLNPELTLGAAAGGGINTRGGSVASMQLNLGYPIAAGLDGVIGIGQMQSVRAGGMSSPILMLGLRQHFSLF